MSRRNRQEWFLIALLIVVTAAMIGLTIWPWFNP